MVPITSIEDLCEKLFMAINARVKAIACPGGFKDWVAVKMFVDGLAEIPASLSDEEKKQLGTDIRTLFEVRESLQTVDEEYFNNLFTASFDPEQVVVVISSSRGYTLFDFGRYFRKSQRPRQDDGTDYEDEDCVPVDSVGNDVVIAEVESEDDENDPDYDLLKNNDTVLDPKNFFANLGIKHMSKGFKPFVGMEFVRNDFDVTGSMTTQCNINPPSWLKSRRERVLLTGNVIFRDIYYIKYVDPKPRDVRVWSNRGFSSCLGSGGRWKTTGVTAGKITKAFDKLELLTQAPVMDKTQHFDYFEDMYSGDIDADKTVIPLLNQNQRLDRDERNEHIRTKRLKRLRKRPEKCVYSSKMRQATLRVTKPVDVTIEDGPLKGSLIRITKSLNSRQFYLRFVFKKKINYNLT